MNNKKYALITGATGGIGEAIAMELSKDYNLVLHCNKNLENLEKLKNKLNDICDVKVVSGNLSDFNKCEEIVKQLRLENLDIEVLINNAGITKDNLILRMKPEDFKEVLEVNLYSAFYMSKLLVKDMMKRKSGKIINISSISGIRGNIAQTNYSASKAALIGFTKSLAKEMASRNILVNAVAPGFIDTEMTQKLSDTIKDEILKDIPLNRVGKAIEVANLVRFLASENSSYITGEVISVDGGLGI